jgi:alanyl-tRNA synthetase
LRIEEFTSCPKTSLLYWQNSYTTSFDAEVQRFEPDKKRRAYVVLDQTAFHPKSGGQPSDRGKIFGSSGGMAVKKVMSVRGVVVHWGKMISGDKLEGGIHGELDWDWRRLLMRRHTAGHLLDHCIELVTETRVQTTGSWLGDPCWVGYSGVPLTEEQVKRVEAIANQQISEGKAVYTEQISKEELMKRAANAPNISRLPDNIELRIVVIEDQGPIPCGGTHVRNIAEIGSVEITNIEKEDQGYRLYYKIS